MHLADAFIQKATCIATSGYTFFLISMCVPWELNPQTFALLTQCSTTEPQVIPIINLSYQMALIFYNQE